MHVREGLWSNAIMFFNVMTAGATRDQLFSSRSPIGSPANGPRTHFSSTTWALWGLFCIVLIVLRVATDRSSRVKVRFKMPVDWAGGIFFACWVGWIMVCFTTFSFHTAPLALAEFPGREPSWAEPDESMFFGLAPIGSVLAFVYTRCRWTVHRPRWPTRWPTRLARSSAARMSRRNTTCSIILGGIHFEDMAPAVRKIRRNQGSRV